MITITREWLQKTIGDMELTRDDIPFGLDEDDSNTLAALRIALASLEAEPVAYIEKSKLEALARGVGAVYVKNTPELARPISLYAAPPAPVFPDEMAISDDMNLYQKSFAQGHNACRAAMLERQSVDHVGQASLTSIQTSPVLDSSSKNAESLTNNPQVIPDGCLWTYDDRDYKWDSACGESWTFIDDGPEENGVKFCQGCGKPVVLSVEPQPEVNRE